MHEKNELESQKTKLQAELQTRTTTTRLELEKMAFRVRELEGELVQKDYEMVRLNEKFTKADAWRGKEARRVEQRDVQLLELKEELAQLKGRNIEAENNAIVQELRREKAALDHTVHQSAAQLQDAAQTHALREKQLQDQLQTLHQQLEWQLPQLAAAAVARASDEWTKKCHLVTKKLRDEFETRYVAEQNAFHHKWHAVQTQNQELDQKLKSAVAESEFLRKEVHRVEDNNKVLLVR